MLRDDYTALNLATVGYTMLHTTGLALNDQATADLALRHLREYTSIVMEINQVIPSVVVADLREDGGVIDESAVQMAVANTQKVWQPSENGIDNNSGNGSSNANSANQEMVIATTKRTGVSRKQVEGESDSVDASEPSASIASATSSTRKRSSASNSQSESPSTTTAPKPTSAAAIKPAASESSPATKKSSGTKRKTNESKATSA
jgi:hypothetical protein